jgi:hypothetical protein
MAIAEVCFAAILSERCLICILMGHSTQAVLHHLSTVTLPLGFFAVSRHVIVLLQRLTILRYKTHYGALTDDFKYHPNVRCMHMQTQVDDEKREVICLYKLIEGRAESSYGTRKSNRAFPANGADSFSADVAHLAGVPVSSCARLLNNEISSAD